MKPWARPPAAKREGTGPPPLAKGTHHAANTSSHRGHGLVAALAMGGCASNPPMHKSARGRCRRWPGGQCGFGGTLGTVGGAAAGALIGHEIGEDKDQRRARADKQTTSKRAASAYPKSASSSQFNNKLRTVQAGCAPPSRRRQSQSDPAPNQRQMILSRFSFTQGRLPKK